MKCPAEVYQPSPRPYTGLPDIHYPLHDKTIVVTRCGRICLAREKINFSQVFAGASGRHHGSARRHMAGQLYGFEPPTSPLSELRSVCLPRKNRFMSGDFVE